MTTCKIKSANSLYDSVCLQHNNPLVIGRGPLTKIKDKRLSRNHGNSNIIYFILGLEDLRFLIFQ